MSQASEIPLFPLGLVLFPGGGLPLRIFEPRYVSMIGRCMREGLPFGVVTIREGRETGTAAQFHAIGTAARVVDFDQLPNGMLGILCRGEERLRVLEHRVQPDQLVLGRVAWLPESASSPPPRYAELTQLLRRILEADAVQSYGALLAPAWDDSGWLANRLAELLPLPVRVRLALLEMDDARQRLDLLYALLEEMHIVGEHDERDT